MVNFDTFWDKKAFNLQKKLLNDLEFFSLNLISFLPYLDAYYFTEYYSAKSLHYLPLYEIHVFTSGRISL